MSNTNNDVERKGMSHEAIEEGEFMNKGKEIEDFIKANRDSLGKEKGRSMPHLSNEEMLKLKASCEKMSQDELLDALDEIGNTMLTNKDQLKVVLSTMKARGGIDWRRESIVFSLNKLQNRKYLDLKEKDLRYFNYCLTLALDEIWGEDGVSELLDTESIVWKLH